VLGVEQAGEVAVQALVAADELIAEAEAGHQAALLQPEDAAEAAAEEDAFHRSEGHQALGEAALVDPRMAQSAFFFTQSTVSMAWKSLSFSIGSLIRCR
jgi:hypothetical protein